MAVSSHLKLRSRRVAFRFLVICLIQSMVMAYFVITFTDAQESHNNSTIGANAATAQIAIGQALNLIWNGDQTKSSAELAGFVYGWPQKRALPVNPTVLSHREQQISRMINDFQEGFTSQEVAQLAQVIDHESRKYRYDPRLLLAVIMTESSLRKNQVSYMGAHGLMQIKPSVACALAKENGLEYDGTTSLFDPAYNVKLGSMYLFDLIMKYGDVRKGLIAYNLGETEMRNRILANQELPSQYVQRVMTWYQEFLEKYPDA